MTFSEAGVFILTLFAGLLSLVAVLVAVFVVIDLLRKPEPIAIPEMRAPAEKQPKAAS